MAAKKQVKLPKYRKQNYKGGTIAFVELNGHRHYLGKYGSSESKQHYKRLLAEWIENGKNVSVDPNEITVVEIIARFWEHAQQHYRRQDGTLTDEVNNFRQALRPLRELYGEILANNFGPLALKAVRQQMIKRGWCRNNINKNIGRVKLVFRWAVENELVTPSVYHGLQAVSGLRYGRSKAKESQPIKPVPDWMVAQTLKQMTPTLQAMVKLQRLTGMRPGELCIIRRCDIDTSGKVWIYKPRFHKTQHHGHERFIYFGPQAQQIIMPFFQPNMKAYLARQKKRAEQN